MALVEKHHVVLREVALDTGDVLRADRVMKDELRPDSAERIPRLFIEIMTIGCRDDLHLCHGAVSRFCGDQ
ncbi:MAG: hypothetical protein WAK82_20130 [Streptosporangiaceae bacterium]